MNFKNTVVFVFIMVLSGVSQAYGVGGKNSKKEQKVKNLGPKYKIYEPLAGFAAFATQDEEKIKMSGFNLVAQSGSNEEQYTASTRYQAMGAEPHTVTVERDVNSGNVIQITHVHEFPPRGFFRTNQMNYTDETLSACTNAAGIKPKKWLKEKPSKEVSCSTVSRATCDKGSRKKEIQHLQPQHLSAMSAQLKQVTHVKVGKRNPKNGAEDKKMREDLCDVLNQQPQLLAPPATPIAAPATNATPTSGGSGDSK